MSPCPSVIALRRLCVTCSSLAARTSGQPGMPRNPSSPPGPLAATAAAVAGAAPVLTNYQQVRHKQKKIRFKTLKPAKEKKFVPKETFTKNVVPQRKMSAEFATKVPTDNIWIHKFYPPQSLTIHQAVTRHGCYARREMLDNEDGFVYADMTLNMETKKKTKYLSAVTGSIVYPHLFTYTAPPRIICFTKDQAEIEAALAAGATHAGGLELINMLKSDALSKNMYEYATTTLDFQPELLPHRHLLKDRLPHIKQGTVSRDVTTMVYNLLNSVQYEAKKIKEDVAFMQVPFGKLGMSVEELVENFQSLVSKLCEGRSPNLKPFITEVKIIAPPSTEEFQLKEDNFTPSSNSSSSKTKAKAATEKEEEEEGEEEEDDERERSGGDGDGDRRVASGN
ncbi:39S ribosomal protein L1, mitochondrial-like [Argonauta hians]